MYLLVQISLITVPTTTRTLARGSDLAQFQLTKGRVTNNRKHEGGFSFLHIQLKLPYTSPPKFFSYPATPPYPALAHLPPLSTFLHQHMDDMDS